MDIDGHSCALMDIHEHQCSSMSIHVHQWTLMFIIAVFTCFGTSATAEFFQSNLCELCLKNYCTNQQDVYSILAQDLAYRCLYTSL